MRNCCVQGGGAHDTREGWRDDGQSGAVQGRKFSGRGAKQFGRGRIRGSAGVSSAGGRRWCQHDDASILDGIELVGVVLDRQEILAQRLVMSMLAARAKVE